MLLATDLVAVDIDIAELVVLAESLQLRIGGEQWAVIPKAHRVRVRQIGADVGLRRRISHVERRFVDRIE